MSYGHRHETGIRRQRPGDDEWYQPIGEQALYEREREELYREEEIADQYLVEDARAEGDTARAHHDTTEDQPATGDTNMATTVPESDPIVNTLPEAPVSMNCFVEMDGVGRVQITARGMTAAEAAAQLRAGIEALRPTPFQVKDLLDCAMDKAIAQDNPKIAEIALKAGLLMKAGKVTPPTVIAHHWQVQGSANLPYTVMTHEPDADAGWSCSCPAAQHHPEQYCKHYLACRGYAKIHGLTL